MKLHGHFFTIEELDHSGTTLRGSLVIDGNHSIFGGHFPQVPVVPGVCMMQMVKEIVEHAFGRPTRLVKADSLKFLQVINPREVSRLGFRIGYQDEDVIRINADLTAREDVCFKFKGSLQYISPSPVH